MSYRVPPHVYHRDLHDEVILLDAQSDAYLGLNQTAAAIWAILAEGGTFSTAVDAVVTRFDVAQEHAEADVADLISELLARGLLVRVSP